MQPKFVFALRGVSNVGKTQTLRGLIDRLSVKYVEKASNQDIRAICEYRGIIIAISTAGDDRRNLENNVIFFKSHSCEIAITAVRTWGATNEIIEAYAKEVGARMSYIDKCRSSEIESEKEKYMDILLLEIDRCIDNVL